MLQKEVLTRLLIVMLCIPSFSSFTYAERGANGTYYTRCKGKQAVDAAGKHVPQLDKICQKPTSKEAGVSESRCSQAQDKMCQGQPADPIDGKPRDVPNGGVFWFIYNGSGGVATVRCRCGCFVADTEILTNFGWHPIWRVLENSNVVDFKLQLAGLEEQPLSRILRGKDFVSGPEKKPIVLLTTDKGYSVHLTSIHPVLVIRDGLKEMIRAKDVQNGDILLTVDDERTSVVAMDSYYLAEDEKVYNVQTGDESANGGIIGVNGLKLGDLIWQLRLSERNSREGNLLMK